MEPVVINATDLRVRTREIMERVKYKGERFLVQTFGQPTAVIISVEEYDKLNNTQFSTEQPAHDGSAPANQDTSELEHVPPLSPEAAESEE